MIKNSIDFCPPSNAPFNRTEKCLLSTADSNRGCNHWQVSAFEMRLRLPAYFLSITCCVIHYLSKMHKVRSFLRPRLSDLPYIESTLSIESTKWKIGISFKTFTSCCHHHHHRRHPINSFRLMQTIGAVISSVLNLNWRQSSSLGTNFDPDLVTFNSFKRRLRRKGNEAIFKITKMPNAAESK